LKKQVVAIIIGIVCFLLTLAICIQINTVIEMTKTMGGTLGSNNALREEFMRAQIKYQNQTRTLERLQKDLEKIRGESASSNTKDKEIEKQIKENNKMLGLTDVKGDGVIIIIGDNRDIENLETNQNVSDLVVHEQDILYIINELFNSGADAVSVNGHRVVSNTAIVCDGNIIRINGQRTGTPITIKAIGYPERMYFALTRPGGWLNYLSNWLPIDPRKATNIKIEKFRGVYNYEYMSTVN